MYGLYDAEECEFVFYVTSNTTYPAFTNDIADADHLWFVLFQYQPKLQIRKFTDEEFDNYVSNFYDAVEAHDLLNELLKENVLD